MARIPLIDPKDHPEFAELVAKFSAGRRGRLINIYRMLLNSPALAESWFNHSNAVRWKTDLDGRLREIVIIRLGHLTKAQYVLRPARAPPWRSPTGCRCRNAMRSPIGRATSFFSAREPPPALAYADVMTRDIVGAGRGLRRGQAAISTPARIVELTVLNRLLQYERAGAPGARARPRSRLAELRLSAESS